MKPDLSTAGPAHLAKEDRYEILVGASSRDIRLTDSVEVAGSILLK